MRGPGLALITIGIAFSAIGVSGRRAFVVIGLAFAVIGIVSLARAARAQ